MECGPSGIHNLPVSTPPFIGVAIQRGIFDNVRTAVDKVETGKARQVNARIAAMASHYLFGAGFCNAAQAERKGRLRRTCRMPTYAGRQAMASTATGYARQHLAEQKALVAATLGG